MKVTSVFAYETQGPRKTMQDVIAHASNRKDKAHYLGVFDGHNPDGLAVARMASQVVGEVASSNYGRKLGAAGRAKRIADLLQAVTEDIRTFSSPSDENGQTIAGGSTATVAVVQGGRLAVAYLGDSEAFYYPERGEAVALTNPHDVDNSAEVERVRAAGYDIVEHKGGRYFAGTPNSEGRQPLLMVSRAVGDLHYGFVSSDPTIIDIPLKSPGTLVIGSDGIWGRNDHAQHAYVETLVRERSLTPRKVEDLAQQNSDNAAVLVAAIC